MSVWLPGTRHGDLAMWDIYEVCFTDKKSLDKPECSIFFSRIASEMNYI